MDVRIVDFPATKVAVVEHRGSPALEHASTRRLVAWRIPPYFPVTPQLFSLKEWAQVYGLAGLLGGEEMAFVLPCGQ